jgi:hypothetical protein
MAADRDAGVDPRFDPVFQRGYDPGKHGERRSRATPRHATGPTPVPPIREPEPPLPASDPADPAATAEAEEADFTLRGRNPFRLALLVGSIAAIGGACLLIWNRIEENPYYQGFSGTDLPRLFRSQLTDAALVPLLTAGLLGLCLWLALGALGRRRSSDD